MLSISLSLLYCLTELSCFGAQICVNGEKDYVFATPSRSSLHSILSLLCTAFAKMTNFALSVVDTSLDSLCLTDEQVLLNKLTFKNEQGQSRPNGNAILAQLLHQTTSFAHISIF
jgi:hypothetical protein